MTLVKKKFEDRERNCFTREKNRTPLSNCSTMWQIKNMQQAQQIPNELLKQALLATTAVANCCKTNYDFVDLF